MSVLYEVGATAAGHRFEFVVEELAEADVLVSGFFRGGAEDISIRELQFAKPDRPPLVRRMLSWVLAPGGED